MSVASRLLLIVACAGSAACDMLAPTAPPPLAIDLPVPLVSGERVHDPIFWSPDGGTIYFIDNNAGYPRIRGVDTTTGITRSVYPEVEAAGEFYQIASRGEYVYTVARLDTLERSAIVRLPVGGGSAELVETDARGFALSANGRMLAWSRNDSLHVRDLVTGQTRVVARKGAPILITDDGEQVAHKTISSGWVTQVAAFSVTTGVATAFATLWPCDVRWSGSRFEVAGRGTSGWFSVEREPGGLVEILPRSERHGVSECDWSPDGRYVAATWVSICPRVNNPSLQDCHAQLLLIDTTTRNVATLATSHANKYMGRPNFSPDGRRIAFTSGDRLYVRDVP